MWTEPLIFPGLNRVRERRHERRGDIGAGHLSSCLLSLEEKVMRGKKNHVGMTMQATLRDSGKYMRPESRLEVKE